MGLARSATVFPLSGNGGDSSGGAVPLGACDRAVLVGRGSRGYTDLPSLCWFLVGLYMSILEQFICMYECIYIYI